MCELMKQQETHLKQQVSYLVYVCSAWSFIFSLPPSAGNSLNFLNVKTTEAGMLLSVIFVCLCEAQCEMKPSSACPPCARKEPWFHQCVSQCLEQLCDHTLLNQTQQVLPAKAGRCLENTLLSKGVSLREKKYCSTFCSA